jgi:hypothetical protein
MPETVARKWKAATLDLRILQALALAVLLADVNSERRKSTSRIHLTASKSLITAPDTLADFESSTLRADSLNDASEITANDVRIRKSRLHAARPDVSVNRIDSDGLSSHQNLTSRCHRRGEFSVLNAVRAASGL